MPGSDMLIEWVGVVAFPAARGPTGIPAVFDSSNGGGCGRRETVDQIAAFAGPLAQGRTGGLMCGANRARPLTRHDPFG